MFDARHLGKKAECRSNSSKCDYDMAKSEGYKENRQVGCTATVFAASSEGQYPKAGATSRAFPIATGTPPLSAAGFNRGFES